MSPPALVLNPSIDKVPISIAACQKLQCPVPARGFAAKTSGPEG